MNARRNLVAIPAGAMILAATTAAPAMAENMFDIGTRATLVARGAAVDVPVTYSCPPLVGDGPYSELFLRVTQVVRGQQVLQAERTFFPICDDTQRTAVVRVTATAGTGAFKSGAAAVDGTFYWSNGFDSIVMQDAQEVRIVR